MSIRESVRRLFGTRYRVVKQGDGRYVPQFRQWYETKWSCTMEVTVRSEEIAKYLCECHSTGKHVKCSVEMDVTPSQQKQTLRLVKGRK